MVCCEALVYLARKMISVLNQTFSNHNARTGFSFSPWSGSCTMCALFVLSFYIVILVSVSC